MNLEENIHGTLFWNKNIFCFQEKMMAQLVVYVIFNANLRKEFSPAWDVWLDILWLSQVLLWHHLHHLHHLCHLQLLLQRGQHLHQFREHHLLFLQVQVSIFYIKSFRASIPLWTYRIQSYSSLIFQKQWIKLVLLFSVSLLLIIIIPNNDPNAFLKNPPSHLHFLHKWSIYHSRYHLFAVNLQIFVCSPL